MSQDFTPIYTAPKGMEHFRFWCQKVLPLVYDDSLSYYELLCKVVRHLNDIIENLDITNENVRRLHDSFVALQNYVNEISEQAERAESAANNANFRSQQAVATATTALEKSEEALTLAMQFAEQYDSVIAIAENALQVANTAEQNANAANATAMQAINTANRVDMSKLDKSFVTQGNWSPKLCNRSTGEEYTEASAVIYDANNTYGAWTKIGNLVFFEVCIVTNSSTNEINNPAGVKLPFTNRNSFASMTAGITYGAVNAIAGVSGEDFINHTAHSICVAKNSNIAVPYFGSEGMVWAFGSNQVKRFMFSGFYETNDELPLF